MQGVQIVHALPSRVRFKIEALKTNPELASEISRLGSNLRDGSRGIETIASNPITGSVLITFKPHHDDPLERIAELYPLIEVLRSHKAIPANLDPTTLQSALMSVCSGTGAPRSGSISDEIERLVRSANAKVESSMGGVGSLRELIPLVLFGMGINTLFFQKRQQVPAWQNYFWFAFATYMALHPASISPTRRESTNGLPLPQAT